MGASAVRLVIAEIAPEGPIRIFEEASRGVLLGRDTFSTGVIRAQTVDATLAALDGFPVDDILREIRRQGALSIACTRITGRRRGSKSARATCGTTASGSWISSMCGKRRA